MHGDTKGGAKARESAHYEAKKEKTRSAQQNALLASIFASQQNIKKTAGAESANAEKHEINVYKDPREGTPDMPHDTIITCKHFLDAVENELYGWRWVCPMGGNTCRYRHMLPEGFVVVSKKDQTAQRIAADKAAACTKTLEEKIEEERAALKFDDGLTPVTAESFAAWKERRKVKKQEELEAKMKEEEAK